MFRSVSPPLLDKLPPQQHCFQRGSNGMSAYKESNGQLSECMTEEGLGRSRFNNLIVSLLQDNKKKFTFLPLEWRKCKKQHYNTNRLSNTTNFKKYRQLKPL